MTILDTIIAAKRDEVATIDAAVVRDLAGAAPPVRGFRDALAAAPTPAIIAEFKRASPSKGAIRAGADPADIASTYEEAGAAALSVLTDGPFFAGALDDLTAARAASSLPVLRKDFIVDEAQVSQARAAGADAVLLIVAALDDRSLAALLEATRQLGMDALVEVHDEHEAERAIAAGADLVGINNRDLRTFATDPNVTRKLLDLFDDQVVVSESGISEPDVVADLSAAGVDAFLVGEALMRAEHPGAELQRLRGTA